MQSVIFSFSTEDSKIVRMFAHFLELRAPEKLRFGRQRLIYARFSLSRIEPVPYSQFPVGSVCISGGRPTVRP